MRSSMGLAGADSFPSVFSVMYGWIITSSSVFLMTPTSCWNFSLITLFLSGKSFGSQPSCTGVRSSPISLYLFVWRFGVVDFCLAFAYGFCMIAFADSAGVNVGSVAVAFSVFFSPCLPGFGFCLIQGMGPSKSSAATTIFSISVKFPVNASFDSSQFGNFFMSFTVRSDRL